MCFCKDIISHFRYFLLLVLETVVRKYLDI